MSKITHKHHQIPVIYLVTNKMNRKVYVGQTVNLYKRHKSHERSAEIPDKYRRPLVFAFKKYGFNNFVFSILEILSRDTKMLTDREQYWMDKLQSHKRDKGYNACPAAGSTLGYKHSDETKRKVSIASAKRTMSAESRAKMAAWHTGKVLSDETKKKISAVKTGVKHGNTKGRKVKQLDADGLKVAEFKSITFAGISTGIYFSNIARACNKTNLKAGGFYWRYV